MNRETEIAHLAIAERAVLQGAQHILQQETRVAELDRDGHDTKQALETLATFRLMQSEHVAHRDLLLQMIRQDKVKPLPTSPIFRPGHYDSRSWHDQSNTRQPSADGNRT
jgi:hypothetical protein